MTGRQDQRVAEGGMAIQSQGDTIVHQGLSTEDMRAIVETLSDQMPKLVATAAAVMEGRLKTFEEDILRRFEQDTTAKREAFADPDFQHVVLDAQRAYARTGDTDTHATLVDLVATRSKENTGTRRAFALNEATAVVSRLTRSEIAELAFSFFVRSTQTGQIDSLSSFVAYMNPFLNEFVDDLEEDMQSYEYMVALRCCSISMGQIGLIEVWKRVYPGLFFQGVDKSQVDSIIASTSPEIVRVFVPALLDVNKWQPNAVSLRAFIDGNRTATLTENILRTVWSRFDHNFAEDGVIVERLAPSCPKLAEAVRKWQASPLRSLDLTTIGKAIGHARLTQVPAFGAPDISVWVH